MSEERNEKMIVNLIKSEKMYTLALPEKVKGQYWLMDEDSNGVKRKLISIEAIEGKWVAKSNKHAKICRTDKGESETVTLVPFEMFDLELSDCKNPVPVFSETTDVSRQIMNKVKVACNVTLNIGRTPDNNIIYDNKYVSRCHASLSYDGTQWSISSEKEKNGIYVNGKRVKSKILEMGECIYIMGLKIVVGHQFLAINNPDNLVKINSNYLIPFQPQVVCEKVGEPEILPKNYFFRSPRFYREIEEVELKIDSPPGIEKVDTMPMILTLGSSMTMGLASMTMGVTSVSSTLAQGGTIMQAMPTIVMAGGMLAGSILFPILNKKYETKQKYINENKRQKTYLEYLDKVRDEIRRICKEQSDILMENLISPEECSSRIFDKKSNLWERSYGQSDFLMLRLGMGNLPVVGDISSEKEKFSMEKDHLVSAMLSLGKEPKQLSNVPVGVSLFDNMILGIYGGMETRTNLLKVLILQMISLYSYDELKIILLSEDEDEVWNFIRPIPHFWNDEKTVRFYAKNIDEMKELSMYIDKNIAHRSDTENASEEDILPYYVIISTSDKLAGKCEPIQQLVNYKQNAGFSIIFSAENLRELPRETKLVICADKEQSRMFDRKDTTGKYIPFNQDIIRDSVMERVSQKIANIELDMESQNYTLPSMMTFLEMFHVSKVEHLNSLTRWKENNPTISLQTPVGVDVYGGTFDLDLHEKFHGPHGLVAGMTGSGKSEFIITYILSLAVNYHPDEVAFVLIDYKGGGLTGAFEDEERGVKLPHLAGTITNLDGAAIKRSLISIQSELRRRQAIFNEARRISNEGTMDIYKYQRLYRDKVVSEPVPHLFIISDEFAELKAQQPDFMEQLISTARIGRSLGVHLILATQKPSGVVDDQIWSNSRFRVCLKVQDKSDSQDMIKCPDAAELSQTGRFYLQVGYNELFALGQSAWCGAEYIPTETLEKTVDSSVQVVDNLGRIMMSVKPEKKQVQTGKKVKQIVSVVKYLSDLASEEQIAVRPLWLPAISDKIYVEDIIEKYNCSLGGTYLEPVIGEYDDPFNQMQKPLTIPFTRDGNCLIFGSAGNGKTTLCTTLCYTLLKYHNADELNLYIMDYGAETLKVFEKAPQVGGVILSSDEEKVVNLIKMLSKEMEDRKTLFSEFGGDYTNYCKNSGKLLPNIVVVLNNYAVFSEMFEDYVDALSIIMRDGIKFGIYFAVTVTGLNSMRYKTQQNFKITMALQLNDASEYSAVVGKTEGLEPSKFKGRGLIAIDRVYEFQTAYCCKKEQQEYLQRFVKELSERAKSFAKKIPLLPKQVNVSYVSTYINGLENIPIGVSKKTLEVVCDNIANKVVYPVIAQDIEDMALFLEEYIKVLGKVTKVVVIDAEKIISNEIQEYASIITNNLQEQVESLFKDMVLRNNTYKEADMDLSSLEKFEEKVYVMVGLKKIVDQLSADGKDKLFTLLDKAESYYKLHFVIAESVSQCASYSYEDWYRKQITGNSGIWFGNGVADQYVLKIGKILHEFYDSVEPGYGYIIVRNRPTLVKLLASGIYEETSYEKSSIN